MIFSKNKPSYGKMYSIVDGIHEGRLFFFVKKKGDKYGFLAIPDMVNHWVDKKDFDFGIENGIVEYIKKTPKYVKKVAKAQFEQNEKG